MKCKKCDNEGDFKEIIDKGIRQEITYEDGYITKEITTYKPDEGKAICSKCGEIHLEYNL